MKKIAVVEGDGIGHEVIPVARKVLEALHPEFEYFMVEVGYGKWEQTGCPCADQEIADLKTADAVLFGAVTTPPMKDYQSVVLRIRKALDLYANLRPVRGNGFDIMIVRENTEGLYSGIEEFSSDRATTLRVVTRAGSERIVRSAIRLVKERKGHLTIGHKANVLKSDVLFRDVCRSEAKEAGIEFNDRFIDALALDLLQHPAAYDVVVTTNIFGDILSDVASYLVGGLGLAPSANIGDRYALFEPVHGSAPDIAGRNIANPIAALRSAAMLLSYLGDHEGASRVEVSLDRVLTLGIRTRDLGGCAGTREFGDAVLREICRE
ncbi:isocitrate/isopropylmalate dehydrogenase family protein [Methanoregula sp.]|uniref:isocitrate/isopropylmalate dehydrogenase family protein n=1 Tax=Methanoregula sp. TaxID=2052170 RepID=UPI002633D9C5|nr:isocitrate/isopropylmalate dehydrogenase family protein [Methanoregula sp.]MDD5143176.1 isocitrate/isopropylmalate dehydrogenase family protein [Methanoregula sp.]